MIKKTVVVFVLLMSYINAASQISFGEETTEEKEWFFALRLMPDMSGGLVQTAIIKLNTDSENEVVFVPVNDWMRQIIGRETSKANPERENLIKKYNVFEVPGEINSDEILDYTYERLKVIISNLWRLKYSEYPYFNPAMNKEKGWAKHPDEKITWMPSESQIRLLRPYGIENLSDFFTGEHLFDLLRDVSNRDWQNRYIQSAGVYTEQP